MDNYEDIAFLLNIAKEIKKSFESPVILLTLKDYADEVYRTLLNVRTALINNANATELDHIVNNFHLQWLQSVIDIDNFRKRIKETPREVILEAIDYTIGCMTNRCLCFYNFIHQFKSTMHSEDWFNMRADLEIMNDMENTVISVLDDKKHCFKSHADQYEYTVKVNYEVNELLNWLDRIYNSLAVQFCKLFQFHAPHLPSDLTNTLKQIIDEVAGSPMPKTSETLKQMESNGKLFCSMVRFSASHDLEISKVVEKIKSLEERINQLKDKQSSSVMALRHKVIYLEARLQSLEDFKISQNALHLEKSRELKDEEFLDNTELHIFNHNLPPEERCRLVQRLIKLWDNALHHEDRGKSIISILSAIDMKEVFTDEIGEFTVDMHGRKIYSQDDGYYQLNEKNELVEVNDDETHIYFYDDCGRYYLDQNRNRIYKAHANASEYELDSTGQLLKLNETNDGIEYRFDHRGRYYLDANDQRIYADPVTGEKYVLDSFGNLVRMRSTVSYFDTCPSAEPMLVQECIYLKQTVGEALKTCLADVLLHQPADPIEFLADSLVKYRRNIEDRQKRRDEETQMNEERQYHKTTASASVHVQSSVSDEEISKSYYDYNLDTYQSMMPEN